MKDKIKKDNQGVTLVEVMVSIAILAVVTTPFLNSFLVSARNNQKARTLLRATTVAQNLMEGVEAFSLEEICKQINQDVGESKLYLPKSYEAHFELENAMGETSGKWVDGNYEFLETNSNQYCFALKGIEEDGHLYDARILLDASVYRETVNGRGMTYNEDYSLDLNVMNENRDVIFSVSRADEEMIFEKAGWNAETDWTKVKRIFRMEVQQDEQNEESEKINISLEYHHEDISQPAQMVVGESLSQTVSDLQNVYIMYYPNYASVEAKIMDCFDVNLNQQESFDLCIVKQKYDTAKSEDYYTVSFDVMDLQPLNREHTDRVILRTNLGKDLYDVNSEAVRQSAVKYSYRDRNGAILRGEEARQRMGFLEQVPQSLLGQKKKNSPMFKTIVEIFPSGTCDGRNPSKFTSTEPLVKLTNE